MSKSIKPEAQEATRTAWAQGAPSDAFWQMSQMGPGDPTPAQWRSLFSQLASQSMREQGASLLAWQRASSICFGSRAKKTQAFYSNNDWNGADSRPHDWDPSAETTSHARRLARARAMASWVPLPVRPAAFERFKSRRLMKSFPAELRKNHPGSALAGDSLFIAFLRRAPDGQLGELLAHCLNLSILGLSPPDAAMLAELGAAPKGFLTWGRNGPDFSAGKGALRLGAFASLAACIPAYARGNLDANTGLRIDIAPYLDDVLRIDDAAAASLMGGFAIHDPSLEELERLPKTQPKAAAANLAIHLLARGLGSCLCATVERVGAAGVLALCERPEAQIPQPFSKQFQDLCAQWSLLAIDKECANLPGRSRPAITRSL